METTVAVIIPCKTAGSYLDECLAHLQRQTYRAFEVYVVPDEPLALADPKVHVIPSGPALPNRKRQLAAAATDAEVVAFIDDDAYPDPGWLAAAVRHFADPSVVAAGGPALTPVADSPRQRASGAVYASWLITAWTRHRYVPEPQRDVESLPSCNLVMRREAFLRNVEATVDYWPGEDILLCLLATRDGKRIVYDPQAAVYHHRRAVFAAHLRQVWNYGRRGWFFRRLNRSWRHGAFAIPAAFVLAHAVAVAAIPRPRLRAPVLLVGASYAALVTWSALREARAARTNPWLVGVGIYLTHLTYGSGTIAGCLRGERRRDA